MKKIEDYKFVIVLEKENVTVTPDYRANWIADTITIYVDKQRDYAYPKIIHTANVLPIHWVRVYCKQGKINYKDVCIIDHIANENEDIIIRIDKNGELSHDITDFYTECLINLV